MGRTPKNIELADGEYNKELAANRGWVEDLFGADLSKGLKPSNRLNANQKKIFKFILDNYTKNVNVLGDIDCVLLENTAIAIDRLHSIEKLINSDFDNIRDKELLSAKRLYQTDFIKGVDYFGMSPASRAKLGVLGAKAKADETDPLLKVLGS